MSCPIAGMPIAASQFSGRAEGWRWLAMGPTTRALFIPHGHWHYVRSLETSLSVNFWF